MTEDKDKSLPVEVNSDEPLGIALSNGLENSGTGQCLDPEDIAAWLEGRITGQKRDEILMHLSSCDSCRETLLLAADLQRKEILEMQPGVQNLPGEAIGEMQPGVQKKKSNIIGFRSLALAASLLIVIFSMYLFFRTDVPQTPGQLAERESEPMEKKVMQSRPSAPMEADLEFTDTPKAVSVPADKKMSPTPAAGEYRLKDTGGESPGGRRAPSRKDSLKKAGKTVEGFQAVSPPAEPSASEEKKNPGATETAGKEETKPQAGIEAPGEKIGEEKTGKAPGALAPKLKAASASVEKVGKVDTEAAPPPGEKQEKNQVAEGKAAVPGSTGKPVDRSDRDRVAAPAAFEKNMAWSQANLLNQQVQTYKAHIPARELQDTFKQAIDLTNQLKKPFEELKDEAAAAGDSQKLEAFAQGVSPLIGVKTGKGTVYIFPNIAYFLSRSMPGSVEFQFFNLARMGWCMPGGGCYGMEGKRDFYVERRQEKGLKKSGDVEDRLKQWEALSPRLDGVFRDVAASTMENLKKQQSAY